MLGGPKTFIGVAMDLTTRCPKCNTVFQASLTDLQLRKGYIRCVQCSHIFDGYAEVVADNGNDPYIDDQDSDLPAAKENEPDFSFTDHRAPEPATDQHFTINLAEGSKPAQTEPFIISPHPDRISADNSRISYAELEESSSLAGLLGWFLLFILVLALLLQGVFVYRAQIAQNLPFTRTALERYCGILNCTVPYLRDVDNLIITKSALKIIKPRPVATDNNQATESMADNAMATNLPNLALRNYELQFNLRNLAAQAQEWPTIVMALKDNSGQVQIRRNLAPKDYLANSTKPLAAQSEVFIRLPLQLNSATEINGFQLDLFFP